MTGYEKELLALAVEACRDSGCSFFVDSWNGGHEVITEGDTGRTRHASSTLTEALTALLTDLGVEVPERPSAVDVAALALAISVVGGDRVKYLRSCNPLTVIALLEDKRGEA